MRLTVILSTVTLLAGTLDTSAAEPSPGAGPIVMRVNPCFMANRTGRGTPCPEPAVSDHDDNQDRAASHIRRALFFIDMMELEKAAPEIDAALDLRPEWVEAHHLSARVAAANADVPRAQREIAVARALAPDDLDIRATNAAILAWRAPREALAEFDSIATKDATHLYARGQRARLLMQFGKPEAAMKDLDFLLSGDHPQSDYLPSRAEASLQMGRPQDAIADYTAALDLDPGRFNLLLARADAFEAYGDNEAALRDYDTILGPIGGDKSPYAIGGDVLAAPLMERAKLLVRAKRFADAATDMSAAIAKGGKPTGLKAQLFLRRNNFPEVPLDGRDSTELRTALASCFALNACFQGIMRAI
jgi:tetratricopeptide (TPR) repeat protein